MTSRPIIRCLIVSRRFPPFLGGTERKFALIAQLLAKRKHRVQVACGRHQEDLLQKEVQGNLTIWRLSDSSQRFWGSFIFLVSLFFFLCKHRSSYDVVIIPYLNETSSLAIFTCYLLGKPTVLFLSSMGDHGNYAWVKKHFLGRLYLKCCQKAQALVAQNSLFIEEAQKLGFSPSQISVIANPVHQKHFRLGISRPKPQKMSHILWCGRLEDVKNPLILPDVIKIVKNQIPEIICHVVGEGTHLEKLKTRVQNENLTSYFIFHGFQSDTFDFYKPFSVLLMTSLSEAMPNVVIEAMSAGLPVIATDVGGIPEMIQPDLEGILVPPDNPSAAATALIQLIENPQNAYQLGQKAYQKALNCYHEDKIIPQWENLLINLTQK